LRSYHWVAHPKSPDPEEIAGTLRRWYAARSAQRAEPHLCGVRPSSGAASHGTKSSERIPFDNQPN
jgi:hypothetical protein